ncbi:MAG TPA: protease pro-enzyme activation domain-containing protein [Terracidiphilus sp.]|jgi:trimeric autotransporter adhesin|nr:protease pro-enzyme activation domain-containing protein [Terracidiphilus sp.]
MANLRTLPLSVLAGTLLSISVSTAQTNRIVATPSTRIVSPVDDARLVTLHGTVSPLATARNDLGAAPDSLQLNRMHLVLKRSDTQEAALQQLINEMHTPGSPSYHQWLTPDQFGAQFGPSDQDIATVTTWLTNHGFNVSKVNPGHQTIEISGSVAQLRNAFHTQIHRYSFNGQTRFANATDPQIPSALAPVVGGFVSLNNFPIRSYAQSYGKAQYDPATNKATPQWTMGSSSSLSFVLAPSDYAVQYDLNPLYNAGVNGTGQTIAIINESNINIDLVNQFRSLFGLPANPPQVIIDGNDPGVDGINNPGGPNFAAVEAYLDVEWAGAIAPNATIDLVIAADTALQQGLILAAERAVYSNIASVISLSFGACEKNLGSSNPFLSSLWEQAAAQGITVAVSTGDSGSAACDNSANYAVGGQAVNGFASTPYNVAVGGSDFYYSQYSAGGTALNNQISGYWNTTPSNSTPTVSLLGYIPEQPWNESQFGLNVNNYFNTFQTTTVAAGSGGASNAAICSGNTYDSTTYLCTSTLSGYPKPTWQTGITGIPNDNVRDTPDVSLFASSGINASYYPLCASDGDCQSASSGGSVQISGVGGTSASAPAFAGIMALVNQKYGRQGQANTVLYPLAKQFPNSFHDITVGTISVPCEFSPTPSTNCITAGTSAITVGNIVEGQIGTGTTPQYNAAPGYDLATGLGTIDAANLVNNWGSVTLAATTTTMTPSATTLAHGSAVTISGTVTGSGTPSGDVALMTDSTEQSQQGATKFTLSNGSYSGTTSNLPGGTYNIWAQYGGDSVNGLSTSSKTQITVNPEASTINLNLINGSSLLTPSAGPGTSVDYGTQLLLNALVAPSSQAAALQTCLVNKTGCSSVSFTAPTGTVTFADKGTTINTAAINSEGDAEYNAPFSVGAHSVTAAYAGDRSYNAAPTSSPITFTVVQDTPQIFVGGSNQTNNSNSFEFVSGTNQPTVLNVSVVNNAVYSAATSSSISPVPVAAPTGTVTVSSSPAGISGSVSLSSGTDPSSGAQLGVGTLTIPASTAANTYTVTLTYNGDTNYKSTTASGSIQIVSSTSTKATTTTATMSGSLSPNSTIKVTGSVTGTGTTAPTGGIIVYSSGNYLTGNSQVSFSSSSGNVSNFSFTMNSSFLAQGANFVTLQYTGDNTYAPSAFTLNSGGSIPNPLSDFTLVPDSSNVPVAVGKSGTANIYLSSVNGFSGAVNLKCAAAGVSCSIPSSTTLTSGSNGTVALTLSAPSAAANGNYNVMITAADSTGQYIHTLGLTAIVTGATSTTPGFTLSNSGDLSITAGATSGNTSTISVNPTNGFTGSVGLSCAVTTSPAGATSPVTCAMSPTSVTIASGALVSTLTVSSTSTTTAGAYAVTVSGVNGTNTQTSVVNVTVNAAPTGTFALSSSGNITVTRGATTGNTSTISVTPSGGFTGTVSLSCAITPTASNAAASCSLTPTSVNVTGASAQTVTLTVNTTAATAFNHPLKLFWPSTGGAVLAVLFFFVPRRRRNWLTMMGMLIVLVSGIAIGCGGGGIKSGGGNTGNTGTTPGTYTVTVTGTSGTTSKTATVSLTVN